MVSLDVSVKELYERMPPYSISKFTIYYLIKRNFLQAHLKKVLMVDGEDAEYLVNNWEGRYCPKGYLFLADVADVLGVSKKTLYRYIQSGILPAIKVAGSYYIKKEDFSDFLKRMQVNLKSS